MTRTFDPDDDPARGELAAKPENLGLPTGEERPGPTTRAASRRGRPSSSEGTPRSPPTAS